MSVHAPIWRPIPGEWPYEAAACGLVRGPDGLRPLYTRPDGYQIVSLHKREQRRQRQVHRLVAAAFLGPSPLEVDHIDGDRSNNSLANLRYLSHAENVRASALAGRSMRGERHVNSKLSEKQVREILARYRPKAPGLLFADHGAAFLAREYGVGVNVICRIVSGETWKHVPRVTEGGDAP